MEIYYKTLSYLSDYINIKKDHDLTFKKEESHLSQISKKEIQNIKDKYHSIMERYVKELEPHLMVLDLAYISLYDNPYILQETALRYEGVDAFFKTKSLEEIKDIYTSSYLPEMLNKEFSEAHEMTGYLEIMLEDDIGPSMEEDKKILLSLISYLSKTKDPIFKELIELAKIRDKHLSNLFKQRDKELLDAQNKLLEQQRNLYSNYDNVQLTNAKRRLLSSLKHNFNMRVLFETIINEFENEDIELFISMCNEKELLDTKAIKDAFERVTHSYYDA